MIILYVLLVAYILSINFYAFQLVKSFRDKEREMERQTAQTALSEVSKLPLKEGAPTQNTQPQTSVRPSERVTGKLCITGLLGGAITIYVCMFVLKYKRSDLLLMVLMPILGVLNVYLWVLLFRSGFSFFLIR